MCESIGTYLEEFYRFHDRTRAWYEGDNTQKDDYWVLKQRQANLQFVVYKHEML